MEIPLLPIDQIQTFLVVTARIAGFMVGIPVFISAQTPGRVKTTLVFVSSLMLFPVMAKSILQVNFAPLPFFLLILSEVLLGLLLGLVARLIFTSVEFGATVVGFQMGFASANVYDPQNQRQVELISQFQNVFAILIFLAIDGHHIFLRTMVLSYNLLPPGQFNVSGEAVPYLMQLASHMFTLGVQLCAPVLAVLLLSGLILGILARVFPQLNVFMLSFPLNIGIGFVVISLTLNLESTLIRREFDTIAERFFTLLNYLNP
ncbi:MAG: flagellar biosynthetic protein FliR [Pseudomonadota bacterium]